ncbi:MAG: flagellar hook-length control protein FliK [Cypionkella sp.]|nr:flagellar hook-length control protein FliK [Cypionkella sp.]
MDDSDSKELPGLPDMGAGDLPPIAGAADATIPLAVLGAPTQAWAGSSLTEEISGQSPENLAHVVRDLPKRSAAPRVLGEQFVPLSGPLTPESAAPFEAAPRSVPFSGEVQVAASEGAGNQQGRSGPVLTGAVLLRAAPPAQAPHLLSALGAAAPLAPKASPTLDLRGVSAAFTGDNAPASAASLRPIADQPSAGYGPKGATIADGSLVETSPALNPPAALPAALPAVLPAGLPIGAAKLLALGRDINDAPPAAAMQSRSDAAPKAAPPLMPQLTQGLAPLPPPARNPAASEPYNAPHFGTLGDDGIGPEITQTAPSFAASDRILLRPMAAAPAVQSAFVSAWLAQAGLDGPFADISWADGIMLGEGVVETALPPLAPASTATITPVATVPTTTAAQLSAQLLPLAQMAQEGPVELVLSPAELGELRFEITQRGDQVQIVLSAERPETADLLRRNAEQLLIDFKNAGFAGASLSFGQWGSGGKGAQTLPMPDGDEDVSSAAIPAPQHDAFAVPRPQSDPSRSLNLRL